VSNPFLSIGDLGAKAEAPTDYWGNYDVPTAGGNTVVPAGRYTFQMPQPGDDFKPGETRAGDFCFEINPTIVAGEHKGKKVNYYRASIKKYSNRNGSQAGDLYVALGLLKPGGTGPKDRNEWARAAMSMAGKKFDAIIKLEAWDKQQSKNLTLITKADGTVKTRYVLTADNVVIVNEDPEKEKQLEDEAEKNGGRVVWANSKIDKVLPVEATKAA
jgi:hypothetical protein